MCSTELVPYGFVDSASCSISRQMIGLGRVTEAIVAEVAEIMPRYLQ